MSKSAKRKSFIIHIDSLDILDDLTLKQAGELFMAIKAYQKDEEIKISQLTKIALSPFKCQFSRDNNKYQALCDKNKQIAINRYSTKSTNRNEPLPTVTKSTDNDSDSDSDNKNDSKSKNAKSGFRPSLPLKEDNDFYIDDKFYNEIKSAYPNVDIDIELKKMRGWLIGNETKQKTSRGIKRFIVSWLAREQDKDIKTQTDTYQSIGDAVRAKQSKSRPKAPTTMAELKLLNRG